LTKHIFAIEISPRKEVVILSSQGKIRKVPYKANNIRFDEEYYVVILSSQGKIRKEGIELSDEQEKKLIQSRNPFKSRQDP